MRLLIPHQNGLLALILLLAFLLVQPSGAESPADPSPKEIAEKLGLTWMASEFAFDQPEHLWVRVVSEQNGNRSEEIVAAKTKTQSAAVRVYVQRVPAGTSTLGRLIVEVKHSGGVGITRNFSQWRGTDFNDRTLMCGKNLLVFAADMSRWKTDAGGKPVESDKGTVKVVVEHGPHLPPEWKDPTPVRSKSPGK